MHKLLKLHKLINPSRAHLDACDDSRRSPYSTLISAEDSTATSTSILILMKGRVLQRGFSLIEIGIVLAVIGLLTSGLIVNYGQWRHTQFKLQTLDYFSTVKKAIGNYAFANRTSERTIAYFTAMPTGPNPTANRILYTSANRPYLPCPDVDGDGLEDRQAVPAVGVQLTVYESGTTTLSNEFLTYGNCVDQKGLLPWRTLEVSPSDNWGNVLIYRVDLAFSNSLIGFDQNSRADVYDPRLPATKSLAGAISRLRISYSQRGDLAPRIISGINFMAHAPSVVCNDTYNDSSIVTEPAVVPACTPAQVIFTHGGAVVNPGDAEALNIRLSAGEVVQEDLTRVNTQKVPYANYALDRTYTVGQLLDGPVVVLVSTGENGAGGYNFELGNCYAIANADPGELENVSHLNLGIVGSTCLSDTHPSIVDYTFNAFVKSSPTHPGSKARSVYDDYLDTMGTGDLSAYLSERGVFPVGEFPPIGTF